MRRQQTRRAPRRATVQKPGPAGRTPTATRREQAVRLRRAAVAISAATALTGLAAACGSSSSGTTGSSSGVPTTLTVLGSTITANQADGGAAGAGGSAGLGKGGGLYLTDGGIACLDFFTSVNIFGNTASTSDNDIFGVFTIC